MPERDLRVPESPAWSGSQNSSKTPSNVRGSFTITSTNWSSSHVAHDTFEFFQVFRRGTLHPLVPEELQRMTSLDGPETSSSRAL